MASLNFKLRTSRYDPSWTRGVTTCGRAVAGTGDERIKLANVNLERCRLGS